MSEDKYDDNIIAVLPSGQTVSIPYEVFLIACKELASHSVKVTEYNGESFYAILMDGQKDKQ